MKTQTLSNNPNGGAVEDVRKRLFMDIMMPMEDVGKYLRSLSEQPGKAGLFNKVLFKTLAIDKQKLEGDEELDKIDLARKRVSEWTEAHEEPSLEYISLLCRYWGISLTDLYSKPVRCSDIMNILNQHVVGQEHYKKALSITTCSYFRNLRKTSQSGCDQIINRIEDYNEMPDPMSPDEEMSISTNSFRNTLLVWGPSGSGKTYGVSVLCKQLGLPMLMIHANSLVKEGIVGLSWGDYFRSAYVKYGKRIQDLVVVVDEFDKIFCNRTYGIEIVNELLNIIDNNGAVRIQTSPLKDSESVVIPTSNMMFVFCGCFSKLSEQIDSKKIGFSARAETAEKRSVPEVGAEDFIKIGLSNELVGRIQNYTYVDELTEADIVRLLNSSVSPFLKYKEVLGEYGYDAELTEDGKATLASIVIKNRLGVRGLETVLKRTLKDAMFESPSTGQDTRIRVDANYVTTHQSNN